MTSTTLRHDPFARGSVRRFCLPNTAGRYACDWCGQKPSRLYAYVWEGDTKRYTATPIGRYYCNVLCMESGQ